MADSLEDPEALVMRFRKDSGLTSAVSYAYANNALRFVRDLEAKGIGLDDVTPDLLESFLKRLARSSGQHSCENVRSAVRSFFRWLESEGILADAAGRVGRRGGHGPNTRRSMKSAKGDAPRGERRGRFGSIDLQIMESFEMERRSQGYNPRPYLNAVRIFSRYLQDTGVSFDKVSPATLKRFMAWAEEAYSANSISTIAGGVKCFYRWLEAKGYCDDAARNLTAPAAKRNSTPRAPLGVDDARRVIDAAGDQPGEEVSLRDSMVVKLMLLGTLRQCELYRADVGDVSYVRDFALIRLRGSANRPGTVAYLPPTAASAVARYTAFRKAGPEDPLVAACSNSHRGTRLTDVSISVIINGAFRRAGIEGRPSEYNLSQTAIDIAMAEGYGRAATLQLARPGSFFSLLRLEQGHSKASEPIQDQIERMLAVLDGGRSVLASAGEIRAMLDGVPDEGEVVVSIGDGGGLSIERVRPAGS